MAADSTTQLQNLIDRMAAGDESARDELISRPYERRLPKLAHKMLQGFPRVRSFLDSGDVLQSSLLRLLQALKSVQPASVAKFFGLVARQMRWELLDLVQRYYGPEGPGGKEVPAGGEDDSKSTPPERLSTSTYDPSKLASWTEFHKAVEALPVWERQVFELLYYLKLEQKEAASILQVSLSTIRRDWMEAKRRLGELLRDVQEG